MSQEETRDEEASTPDNPEEAENEVDRRSIYVGNVHYAANTEELRALFKECGCIERVTIPADFYGQPKGYAYIEFDEHAAVLKAEEFNEKELKGRKLKVQPKVTTESLKATRGRPYGRGRYYYPPPRRSRFFRSRYH